MNYPSYDEMVGNARRYWQDFVAWRETARELGNGDRKRYAENAKLAAVNKTIAYCTAIADFYGVEYGEVAGAVIDGWARAFQGEPPETFGARD